VLVSSIARILLASITENRVRRPISNCSCRPLERVAVVAQVVQHRVDFGQRVGRIHLRPLSLTCFQIAAIVIGHSPFAQRDRPSRRDARTALPGRSAQDLDARDQMLLDTRIFSELGVVRLRRPAVRRTAVGLG
jgi:hypothetical protein